MSTRIPVVNYLVLGDDPHLVANTCTACGAHYFDRRNACARCGGQGFEAAPLATTGRLRAFSVVHQAPPGTVTPYVSGVVELDGGGRVRSTVRGVEPVPGAVSIGMRLELVTFLAGTDDEGTEAVAFAFEPAREG